VKIRTPLGRVFATLAVVLLSINAASARPPGIGTPPGPVVAPADFIGTWYAQDPDGSLVKVIIGGSGTSLTVNPFGDCSPSPCDDGTQPLGPGGSKFVDSPQRLHLGQATFTFKFKTMLVEVDAIDDGHKPLQLIVRQTSTFTDHSKRKNYQTVEMFTKTVVSHHVDPFVGTYYGQIPGSNVQMSITASGSGKFSAYFSFSSTNTFGGFAPPPIDATCSYSGAAATCDQGITMNLTQNQITANVPGDGGQMTLTKG